MRLEARHLTSIRIDLPLKTSTLYFFVWKSDEKWDPWWSQLWELLSKHIPNERNWSQQPEDDGSWWIYADLDDEERIRLRAFMRTAPTKELTEHQSLKRAVAIPDDRLPRLQVLFFGRPFV